MKCVVYELPNIFEGWIGYYVWAHSMIPFKEIMASVYVVAQDIYFVVVFNKFSETSITSTRLPRMNVSPI